MSSDTFFLSALVNTVGEALFKTLEVAVAFGNCQCEDCQANARRPDGGPECPHGRKMEIVSRAFMEVVTESFAKAYRIGFEHGASITSPQRALAMASIELAALALTKCVDYRGEGVQDGNPGALFALGDGFALALRNLIKVMELAERNGLLSEVVLSTLDADAPAAPSAADVLGEDFAAELFADDDDAGGGE